MPDMLRSPIFRAILAVVAVCLFYVIGIFARQHSGVRVVIRNETKEPVLSLGVMDEKQGDRHSLPDLAPGDNERAFVQAGEHSRVVMEFAQPGRQSRTVTIFDNATPGDCGSSTVWIQPPHNTESVEEHPSVCWKSWLDFL